MATTAPSRGHAHFLHVKYDLEPAMQPRHALNSLLFPPPEC
jgi:hypothetical protein